MKPRNYNILPRIRTEFPHRQLSGQRYDNMASGGIERTGPRWRQRSQQARLAQRELAKKWAVMPGVLSSRV
jgi:hypothetical protein